MFYTKILFYIILLIQNQMRNMSNHQGITYLLHSKNVMHGKIIQKSEHNNSYFENLNERKNYYGLMLIELRALEYNRIKSWESETSLQS